MNEITFNACDWTGEEITVAYTDTGEFSLYGYTFWVGDFNEFGTPSLKPEGCRQLFGSDWGDDALTTMVLADGTVERAVIAAARWVRNHV